MANKFVSVQGGKVVVVFSSSQNSQIVPGYQVISDASQLWLDYVAAKQAAAAQQAAQNGFANLLAQGLQIQSTGSPGLNGTYVITQDRLNFMGGILAGIAKSGELPGGQGTFIYPEMDGTPHVFDAVQFANFAQAVSNWVYAASNGAPPPQPVVIA